jgi:hypothetical protein
MAALRARSAALLLLALIGGASASRQLLATCTDEKQTG